MTFICLSMPMSPRMVPGSAWAESVGPTILRTRATASTPNLTRELFPKFDHLAHARDGIRAFHNRNDNRARHHVALQTWVKGLVGDVCVVAPQGVGLQADELAGGQFKAGMGKAREDGAVEAFFQAVRFQDNKGAFAHLGVCVGCVSGHLAFGRQPSGGLATSAQSLRLPLRLREVADARLRRSRRASAETVKNRRLLRKRPVNHPFKARKCWGSYSMLADGRRESRRAL